MSAAPPSGLDWLSGNLAKVSAILGLLTGIPPLLLSCSNQEIERRRALQNAVNSEAAAWRELYGQYLAVIAKQDTLPAARTEQLLGICTFANRPVVDLTSFPVGEASPSNAFLGFIFPRSNTKSHEDAKVQLSKIRSALFGVLQQKGIGLTKDEPTRCIEVEEGAVDPNAEKIEKAAPADIAVEVATATATIAQKISAASAPASLTVSAGDSDGYDIDIFWCRGAGEEGRFAYASALAEKIKTAKLLGSDRMGRVRLRALSTKAQANPAYPNSGLQVRGEASEIIQARSLIALLNTSQQPKSGFFYFRSNMKTPFYLSAFVCAVPSA